MLQFPPHPSNNKYHNLPASPTSMLSETGEMVVNPPAPELTPPDGPASVTLPAGKAAAPREL